MTSARGGRRFRESNVLIAAALPTDRNGSLCAMAGSLDAERLLELAEYHRISALLHQRLASINDVPVELTEELARRSRAAGAARLHAQRTLKLLAATLDAPYLVVKGPVLATHWYDDPGCREFNDIDILIQPSDFRHALEQLTAAGFEPLATNWHGFLEHGIAEVPLGFESSVVDLHWNLVAVGRTRRELRLSTLELFHSAETITIDGAAVLTLDPTDTLLHLCVNVGLDGARRLRGLIDIDTVVRSGRIHDLDTFVERARRSGAGPLSAAVLQRARTLLGTPMPRDLLEQLATSRLWLAANRTVDRLGPAGGRSSIAPGLLLGSGRQTGVATARALGRSMVEALPPWTGRTALSGEAGELSWQRTPDDGDVATHRDRYLEFVDQQAQPVRVVRCRDVDELHRRIGALQPRTTPMLGAAFLYGLRGRRTRADLLEYDDGTLAGALVRHRWTVGHCTAFPLLIDAAVAPIVGRIIERSSVTDVAGMESDTSPLRAHLPRWRTVDLATPASLPSGFSWTDEGTDVRRAVRSDLGQLVDVVWRYSPHAFPNRWLLSRRLSEAIDDLVLVLEIGDPPRAVGYGIRDGSTPEYDLWAQGVILPEHRGGGLAWHMVAAAAADASRRGVGGLVLVVESNPMPIPDDAVVPEAWAYVTLSRPRRIRGEARARALADRMLALPARWQGERSVDLGSYRSPGADDALVTNRRSQAWWQRRRSES